MVKRIAINGFGRIGRLVMRCAFHNPEVFNEMEFVCVNDLTGPDVLAYLFKYDSIHRRFPGDVSFEGDNLVINGKTIKVTAEKDPAKLPWREMGIDVVVESTGRFVDGLKAKAHLDAGAKKVIISAPATNEDACIVIGVNDDMYDSEKHHIVSNASCTTNCLAPMVKVLHDNFKILSGLMTTAHSYTNDQAILDFPHAKAFTRGRAAAMSIIPTSTGAAKAISKIIPDLSGKLNGLALRVPTPDVSIVDFVAHVEKKTSVDDVNKAMKAAAESYLKGILQYEETDLVSMDFVGDPHSCIYAAKHTYVVDDMIKVLGWYDNEWAYSFRVIDVIRLMIKKGL